MKGLAVTNPGMEEISASEIGSLLGKNACKVASGKSVVSFNFKEYSDLCLLCYKTQSVSRILLLLGSFSFKSIDDLSDKAGDIVKEKCFGKIVSSRTRFKVECTRVGEHDFSSNDIESAIGEHIDGIVDLDKAEIIVHAFIYHDMCHMGIDFAGFDLSKRQYRIFTYKDSLKATVAYSLLMLAKYDKKDFLLDPFCSTGTIPIEAAIHACNMPVNYHNKEKLAFTHFDFIDADVKKLFDDADSKVNLKDKLRIYGYDKMFGYTTAAQKNAKIAGVNKQISISRADIEWMDTKVEEKQADKIVSMIPENAGKNPKETEKLYREFFHQAEFIISDNGLIVLVSNQEKLMEKYSEHYKMKIDRRLTIMQGKKPLEVFVIMK